MSNLRGDVLAALRDRCLELGVTFRPDNSVQELLALIVQKELSFGFTLPDCFGKLYSADAQECAKDSCTESALCHRLSFFRSDNPFDGEDRPPPGGAVPPPEMPGGPPEGSGDTGSMVPFPPTVTPPNPPYRFVGPGAAYNLPVGSVLRREYVSRKTSLRTDVYVTVTEAGFMFGGRVYQRLSQVMHAVTGRRNFSATRFFLLMQYNPHVKQ